VPFVLNAWYVVAWPHEILAEALLARTVCNNAMVVWRGTDGIVHALEDRCPHREMPMSLGILEQGGLRCRYHGLLFAPNGKCTEVPGQDRISAGLEIRRYPTVEKYGWIWVWPGDAAKADASLVPEAYAHNDRADLEMVGRTAHFKANYLMVIDNLLDLTHEPFLHPTSLGNAAVYEAPAETFIDESSVRVERWMLGKLGSPMWVGMLQEFVHYEGPCDRWQKVFFAPPSGIYLHLGAAPAGAGALQGDLSRSAWFINNQFLTPETETSTLDFWSVANADFGRERIAAFMDRARDTILKEDQIALEGCQSVIDRQPGRKNYSIPTDKAGLAARRIVARMLAAEKRAQAHSG
jgi:phenylpropionate dioxygenase-like ring-hydroxylating dioxygenase large terminal subunit